MFCSDLLNNKECRTGSRRVALPMNVSKSCWSMKGWHLHLPPCVNTPFFLCSYPSPAGSELLRTYRTRTDCCWDEACSENQSTELCSWMTNVLKSCCYEAGSVIVNYFPGRFFWWVNGLHWGLNDSIAVCAAKRKIRQTHSHFLISNKKKPQREHLVLLWIIPLKLKSDGNFSSVNTAATNRWAIKQLPPFHKVSHKHL